MASLFSGSLCVIVTGASRGFGQAVCIKFAEAIAELNGRAKFVILSRHNDGLAETSRRIKEISENFDVQVLPVDISNLSSLPTVAQLVNSDIKPNDYDNSIIVHNAASLESRYIIDADDLEEITNYTNFNFASCVYLTSKFLQLFRNSSCKLYVVNISSLCAIQPYKSWGIYCCMKAARDMLISTVSEENPSVRTVNYAPGPMNTKLLRDALNSGADEAVKTPLEDAIQKNLTVDPMESAAKLTRLLKEDKYANGLHFDIFDEFPQ